MNSIENRYNLSFVSKRMKERTYVASKKNLRIYDELSCKNYDDVYFEPSYEYLKSGLLYDKCGKPIFDSHAFGTSKEWTIQYLDVSSITDTPYDDNEYIWLGNIPCFYGHAITDGIKSLWFTQTEDFAKLSAQGVKFALTLLGANSIPPYFVEILIALGINQNNIIIFFERKRIKRIWVPNISWSYIKDDLRGYHIEFVDTVNRIRNFWVKKMILKVPIDKVYFTRTGFKGSRDMGEAHIEKVFSDMGFTIIEPEKLSLSQQISILNTCKQFAATEGSISHNSMFCNSNASIIIIRKVDWINPHQLALNQAFHQRITYIDCNASLRPPYDSVDGYRGPFYLCVTKELKRFACKHTLILPFYLRPSYWLYLCKQNGFIKNNFANRKIIHRFENLFSKKNPQVTYDMFFQ